ncbi:hypothetical protein BG011_000390 [Mortierella polycephala]|uniref:DIS3-like exonuclease 2 n=1 Tax=Mortierella polycephala TaxID=41804 RepID=A0A9P6U762_9FUNG|nr:hypothetical protein BG011_000390 [Mortierella polycephala]
MTSTLPPTAPIVPVPTDVVAAAAVASNPTAALNRSRSQRGPTRHKDQTKESKDNKDNKGSKKQDKKSDNHVANGSGSAAASEITSPTPPSSNAKPQGPTKRRGSRATKNAGQSMTNPITTNATTASPSLSDVVAPADTSVPKKSQTGSAKRNGRSSTKKQQSKATNSVGENLTEDIPSGLSSTSVSTTLTPKRTERLSSSTHPNNNDNNSVNSGNGSGSDKKKSTHTTNSHRGKKKSSSNANNKEPAHRTSSTSTATADADADADVEADGKAKPDSGAVASTKDKKERQKKGKANSNHRGQENNTEPRQNNKGSSHAGTGANTDITRQGPKDNKDKANSDKSQSHDNTTSSKDARPSSITSSCSFMTSSSSLSPTSSTSSSSSSSSPAATSSSFTFNTLVGGRDSQAADMAGAPLTTVRSIKSTKAEAIRIRTNVARDFTSSSQGPFSAGSPLSMTSPSSRRSSTLTPLGDKLGRLGAGLPTVDENVSERQTGSAVPGPLGGQPLGGPFKGGRARSLSMKEQLVMMGQENSKEGKLFENLQDIISSLKSLPPTNAAIAGNAILGEHPHCQPSASRHEKRLSMSSLPSSRNSVGQMGAFSTSTTLHISQPPRGTSIENALQTTVATLRRLSVSDSKRPLIPLKEEVTEPNLNNGDRVNNRRSITLNRDTTATEGNTFESRRTSAASGYQPNRRSVVIRPEEVAALQEGRPYNHSAFSFSSDDEPDAIADTLSALEGKSTNSNRSSYSSKSHSQMDTDSLAEFAAKLPNHMRNVGAAALVNNDDVHDRRRFTTAYVPAGMGSNRTSALPNASMTSSASKRLSGFTMSSVKESDRKDWRMSTPVASNGPFTRDSVSLRDNANGRRPLFMAHLTYSDFHSLLTKQKHKYVQGVLRINKRNRSDAYVTVDSLPEGDVYICGSKDRNRALEGDVVGIELIDPEELSLQKLDGNKDKKKNRKADENDDSGEAEADEIKPKYCGRVVSIVERSFSQMFSGTLTLQRPSGSTKKNERKKPDEEDQKGQPRIVWFKPTDKRVPLIAIPIDQAPADFIECHPSYVHKLFVASIKRWPLSSLHPFGQLERELGDIGNIEIETEALLADNNVTTTAFGEKVEKCLPDLPWAIPDKELSRRRDLRQSCIFTIDPSTAKDLDDAVSCTPLEDGTYEIGVHIADVSHFIKVGSALDREAKSRATTVYLVQKAIPMLPNVLCEDLCSLKANVDRLAFSVFWKMTEDGHVLETSFAKSVIRSCAQLSYDDAQRVITTGSLDPKIEVVGHPRSLIEDNIKVFFKLSQILRQKRFENGALSINSIKLSFETDEICNPVDVSVYELKESNRLIEEFMLLANMSVAKQICEFFPEQALLRRHEDPLEKKMGDFILYMNKIGLDLDASSSGALQQSLDAIQDPDVRKVVRLLMIKPMQRAKYICSGMLSPDKFQHYALNAPLYTHFTSPIRRYADIIVHRMLEASLVGDSKFYLTPESCQKNANHCNIKKDAAKLAQEQSSHIYLSVLLKNMTESKGKVVKDAIVVQVLDAAFDVLIPEYGIEKRVYVDQLPLESHAHNESTSTLKLYWTTAPFKIVVEEEETQDGKNHRLSVLPSVPESGIQAMDHPDDATNAYDDERGLFDDESDDDYEDDGVVVHVNGVDTSAQAENEDDEDESNDEANRLTRIRIFGHVQVLITADTAVSPPVIRVVAMNPYASSIDNEAASEL